MAFHLEWLAHVECFRSDARHTTKWKNMCGNPFADVRSALWAR
jgi:hypothetical protein